MKKQKKRRQNKNKKQRGKGHSGDQDVIKMPMRKRKTGELGIFDRDYPTATERQKVIVEIQSIPDVNRGPDEWWMLGEFLVYNGLMDEDDSLINEGIQALTQGANHPTPSPACLLDLAWILMFLTGTRASKWLIVGRQAWEGQCFPLVLLGPSEALELVYCVSGGGAMVFNCVSKKLKEDSVDQNDTTIPIGAR